MPNDPVSTGFSHIAINVTDLARSVAFYEAVTTLRRTQGTPAPSQSFSSLGIASGRFDGAILRDPNLPFAPAIHLMQWDTPKASGRCYPSFTNPGYFRICFQFRDATIAYDRALAAGARPFTPPLMPEGQNVTGRPVFSTPDPDGIVLQFVSLPGVDRLYHMCCNCRDLEPTVSLFESLGLRVNIRGQTSVPVGNSFGPPQVPATYEAALLNHPIDEPVDNGPSFSLDLCRWTRPEPEGQVYPSQSHLGIVRLGLAVRDIDRAHARLAAAGLSPSAKEIRDFGPEIGTRSAFTLATPEGAMVELVDRRL